MAKANGLFSSPLEEHLGAGGEISDESLLGGAFRRLVKDKLALLGLVVAVLVVLVGIFAPYIMPNDPTKVLLDQRLAPSSVEYPLGTDHLGRCLLSRLIYGTRISLSTAAIALLLIMLISIMLFRIFDQCHHQHSAISTRTVIGMYCNGCNMGFPCKKPHASIADYPLLI